MLRFFSHFQSYQTHNNFLRLLHRKSKAMCYLFLSITNWSKTVKNIGSDLYKLNDRLKLLPDQLLRTTENPDKILKNSHPLSIQRHWRMTPKGAKFQARRWEEEKSIVKSWPDSLHLLRFNFIMIQKQSTFSGRYTLNSAFLPFPKLVMHARMLFWDQAASIPQSALHDHSKVWKCYASTHGEWATMVRASGIWHSWRLMSLIWWCSIANKSRSICTHFLLHQLGQVLAAR